MSNKIKLLCRFGWHDWSKWEIASHGRESFVWQDVNKGSDVTLQKRTCRSCGLVVTKIVTGIIGD